MSKLLYDEQSHIPDGGEEHEKEHVQDGLLGGSTHPARTEHEDVAIQRQTQRNHLGVSCCIISGFV